MTAAVCQQQALPVAWLCCSPRTAAAAVPLVLPQPAGVPRQHHLGPNHLLLLLLRGAHAPCLCPCLCLGRRKPPAAPTPPPAASVAAAAAAAAAVPANVAGAADVAASAAVHSAHGPCPAPSHILAPLARHPAAAHALLTAVQNCQSGLQVLALPLGVRCWSQRGLLPLVALLLLCCGY